MRKRTQKERDLRTLEAIGRIYCRARHTGRTVDGAGLCAMCRQTVEQTLERAETCPYGHTGNCQDCPAHCQRGEAQECIRQMMRYAAPRMAFRHPPDDPGVPAQEAHVKRGHVKRGRSFFTFPCEKGPFSFHMSSFHMLSSRRYPAAAFSGISGAASTMGLHKRMAVRAYK